MRQKEGRMTQLRSASVYRWSADFWTRIRIYVIIAAFGLGVAIGFFAIQLWQERAILVCEAFIGAAWVMSRGT